MGAFAHLVLFCFFEAVSFCVARCPGTCYAPLAQYACLCFPSAGIKGLSPHAGPVVCILIESFCLQYINILLLCFGVGNQGLIISSRTHNPPCRLFSMDLSGAESRSQSISLQLFCLHQCGHATCERLSPAACRSFKATSSFTEIETCIVISLLVKLASY